ncbi:hypothetical protein ACFQX4_22775, partial [Roseomonas sp. GCM10028921]
MAEHDAAKEEHLGHVSQSEAIPQAPEHHERDDVARVLRPVQHASAALVEPSATSTAPEAAVALGRTVLPKGTIQLSQAATRACGTLLDFMAVSRRSADLAAAALIPAA